MNIIKFDLEQLKKKQDGFSYYILGRSYDLEENGAKQDYEKALEYLRSVPHPIVIKASGLAAGKGVVLPEKGEEEEALKSIMLDNEFGSAGNEVVIEERLVGFFLLCL